MALEMLRSLYRSVNRKVLAVLGSSLLLATAAHAGLPGGKAYWVVSVGSLSYDDNLDVDGVDTNEWVRLGYYTFKTDGTVLTNYWYWASKELPPHVDSVWADCPHSDVDVKFDVPNCMIQTVASFTDGTTSGGFTGTYKLLTGGRVQVTWTKKADGTVLPKPLNEYWTLEEGLLSDQLARIKSPTFYQKTTDDHAVLPARGQFSDYAANFGVGYGSNASLANTSRATMDALINDPRYNAKWYRGFNPTTAWTATKPETRLLNAQISGGRWSFAGGTQSGSNAGNKWTECDSGKCIGWRQTDSSCSCAGSTDKDRILYRAEIGGGRRNAEWSWCHCLATPAHGDSCYSLSSHVRPLLQVVDDQGVFRGWVGVEASSHIGEDNIPDEPEHAHYGVFDMVEDGTLFTDPKTVP